MQVNHTQVLFSSSGQAAQVDDIPVPESLTAAKKAMFEAQNQLDQAVKDQFYSSASEQQLEEKQSKSRTNLENFLLYNETGKLKSAVLKAERKLEQLASKMGDLTTQAKSLNAKLSSVEAQEKAQDNLAEYEVKLLKHQKGVLSGDLEKLGQSQDKLSKKLDAQQAKIDRLNGSLKEAEDLWQQSLAPLSEQQQAVFEARREAREAGEDYKTDSPSVRSRLQVIEGEADLAQEFPDTEDRLAGLRQKLKEAKRTVVKEIDAFEKFKKASSGDNESDEVNNEKPQSDESQGALSGVKKLLKKLASLNPFKKNS